MISFRSGVTTIVLSMGVMFIASFMGHLGIPFCREVFYAGLAGMVLGIILMIIGKN